MLPWKNIWREPPLSWNDDQYWYLKKVHLNIAEVPFPSCRAVSQNLLVETFSIDRTTHVFEAFECSVGRSVREWHPASLIPLLTSTWSIRNCVCGRKKEHRIEIVRWSRSLLVYGIVVFVVPCLFCVRTRNMCARRKFPESEFFDSLDAQRLGYHEAVTHLCWWLVMAVAVAGQCSFEFFSQHW